MPARSKASQAVSSSSRCCGSMARASRGLMPKKAGSNCGGVVEESALAHMGPAGGVGVGVVDALDVPAAVGGEVADGVRARVDQLPQLFGRADPAGVAAAHRDDRDGFLGRLGELGVLPAQPLVLEQ